jgi:photosystem II stability/assembly factor-like uncharacterized protein
VPTTLFAATGAGIFKSMTAGEVWSSASTGLTTIAVLTVAIDPGSTGKLYACTGSGLFRSGDNGASWGSVDTGSGGTLFNAIAIDRGGAILLGGESAVSLSADGGKSWKTVLLPAPPPAEEEP